MAFKGMVILDTNILIEIIRKNGEIILMCDNLGTANLAITSVTRNEFLLGSRDKESFAQNLKFVNKFHLLEMNGSIDKIFSRLCETYALSHRPGIPDMIIAATSIHYACELYTLNTKDFSPINPHFQNIILLVRQGGRLDDLLILMC